mmetsp:Transcript_7896/g.17427  ORF Transcript_7896/g.17427 Transcript_7896/m.17427 type:complete len:240 (-) Transcript_7896:1063-1782(-)
MLPYLYVQAHPSFTIQAVFRGIGPIGPSGCFHGVSSRMVSKNFWHSSVVRKPGRCAAKDLLDSSFITYLQRFCSSGGCKSPTSFSLHSDRGASHMVPYSLSGTGSSFPFPLPLSALMKSTLFIMLFQYASTSSSDFFSSANFLLTSSNVRHSLSTLSRRFSAGSAPRPPRPPCGLPPGRSPGPLFPTLLSLASLLGRSRPPSGSSSWTTHLGFMLSLQSFSSSSSLLSFPYFSFSSEKL